MKSRSEVLKSRSQVVVEKKTTAAERTKPMFDDATTAPTSVKCDACEETSKISDLEKRDDGTYECPHCANPIEVKGLKKGKKEEAPPMREPGDDTDVIEKEMEEDRKAKAKEENSKKAKVETRTSEYCGECGSEWPTLDGKTVINCGHKNALRVDDPRKAKNMRAATPSGVTVPPASPVSMTPNPTAPVLAVAGRRISLTWGESTFPIAQYSNMKVGNFIMSREVANDEDPVEVARRMLADLQKIADTAFDTQVAWYKKKLGLLDK